MNIKREHITRIAAIVTIAVSSLVLIGWFADIAVFKSIKPGVISIKFNTAICFLLLGISLFLLNNEKAQSVIKVCSAIVILTGFLTLCEYIFKWNIGIDELLWKEGPGTAETLFPGRPSAFTAFNCILLGITLLRIREKRWFAFTWVVLSVVFLISILAFLSYLFGVPYLNGLPSLTKIALHTSVLFLVLCLGIYQSAGFRSAHLSFQRRLTAGFILVALLLVLVFYLDNKNDQNFIDDTRLTEQSNEAISMSDQIVTSLTRMESGIRGFLVTKDKKLLGISDMGREKIFIYLGQLSKLVTESPIQKNRVDSITKRVVKRFYLFDNELALWGSKENDENKMHDLISDALATMDSIKRLIGDIKEAENKIAQERKTESNSNLSNGRRVVYFFGFIVVIILIALLLIIFRNTNARIRAEEEARQLAVTLEKRVQERTQQLVDANAELQRLSLHLKNNHEDERLYLSREVLDQLGQLASAMKLEVDWLQNNLTGLDEKASARIEHALYIVKVLIEATGNIAVSLRPAIIDELGLNASLKWQCDQFRKLNNIRCDFVQNYDDAKVSQQVTTELFRICQESLANVLQHSRATHVLVSVREVDGAMRVSIIDNGIGFDAAKKKGHLGLVEIRERVLSIRGELQIVSEAGKGTAIHVIVPKTDSM